VLSLSSAALVTIDVQVDTLDGQPFEIPGTTDAVPAIGALAAAFRAAGRPIVHVIRLYDADGSNAEPVRREAASGPIPLLRPGTPGRLLAPGLLDEQLEFDDSLLLTGAPQAVGPGESLLYKPRWGAFFKTPLEELLRTAGVDTIVFAGCNFPNCPRTSIYEASERDFSVVVASDALSGLYDRGRDELRGIGVEVVSSAEIIGLYSFGAAALAAPGDLFVCGRCRGGALTLGRQGGPGRTGGGRGESEDAEGAAGGTLVAAVAGPLALDPGPDRFALVVGDAGRVHRDAPAMEADPGLMGVRDEVRTPGRVVGAGEIAAGHEHPATGFGAVHQCGLAFES
jgi:nicotinamidase-related amidase